MAVTPLQFHEKSKNRIHPKPSSPTNHTAEAKSVSYLPQQRFPFYLLRPVLQSALPQLHSAPIRATE
jgi:hypothetical protein